MITLRELLDRIREEQHIFLYGAGLYAEWFFVYLKINNMENRIKAFVVTNLNNNPPEKHGIPVLALEDARKDIGNSFIVITVGEKVNMEIQKMLSAYGMANFFPINKGVINELHEEFAKYFSTFPIQRNKIFVDCFRNLGYRCNCKYIAKELLEREFPVEIVWSIRGNSGEDLPKEIRQVEEFSYEFYKEFYTSGIIIGNMGPTGYLKKRKEQYYVNTWHGSGPFKKVGVSSNIVDEQMKKEIEHIHNTIDLFVSNTGDNTQMFRESFLYHGEIYECGSPRNDVFFTKNRIKNEVYKKLKIDKNKKILLYVPTYRESRSFESYDLDMQRVLRELEHRFAGEFVLLYRFHHFLYQFDECKNFYTNAVNVTMYSDIQELLVASDVLITDYSSAMWDFSLQDRPVFLYQNDRSEYEDADRGFYCPPKEWPYPRAHSSEEMIEVIRNFDEEKYLRDLHMFIDKYQSYDDGHASERVVERIMDVIEHPQKYGKE